MRKTKKGIAIGLALIMTAMPAFQHGFFVSDVKAATQKGSLATKEHGHMKLTMLFIPRLMNHYLPICQL